MANYIGTCVTAVPDYMVKNIIVPAATSLVAGNVCIVNTLDATSPDRNCFAFAPTKPITAGFAKYGVSVIGSPSFEMLADGRLPAGNPNYTTYTYATGDVATGIEAHAGMIFQIGIDSIVTGSKALAVKGNFLIPTNDSFELTATATEPSAGATASKTYFKILNTKYFQMGGVSASEMTPTLICQVIEL